VRVAPEYAAAAPALTADWLTRHEVFERVEAVFSASSPAPATLTLAPIKVVWAALVGALALIPILCACLSALLLSPGIANTRQMIAVANAPTATEPLIPITATELGPPIGVLESPIETPQLEPTQPEVTLPAPEPTAVTVTPTEQAPTLPPMITVEILTPTSQPTAIPTATPAPAQQPTATLPSTFTPVPVPTSAPPNSPIATPSNIPTVQLVSSATPITQTAIALTPVTTSTPAVSVTATPQITSGVVISTIMYMGNPGINQADQYVEIYNRGPIAVNVSKWIIRAVNADKWTELTNGLVMQPGQACRVYTNSPVNYGECGAMSFYSAVPVWSASGDTAQLIDTNGVIVHEFRYP
jgi:hypothetical protein